jgi:hypothetical protein
MRSVVFTGLVPALAYLVTHRRDTGDGERIPDAQMISGACTRALAR